MSGRLEVIRWRDIPAQVMGTAGRDRHRVELSGRFQEAIDRAATRAGMTGTDDYLAEWRKDRATVSGDVAEVVRTEASNLEQAFTEDVLEQYVKNLGWKP